MYSEGDGETRSSSPYRISAHHARSNTMTTQWHLQTASEDRNTSFDSGCGPAEDTRFIRDLLCESRQVREENMNCASESDLDDCVLEAHIVHRKQISHVDDFDRDGSTVTTSKVFLEMDKETEDVTDINDDVKIELKEKVTAKFRIATPEELNKNMEIYGKKNNNNITCDNLDTDRNITKIMCRMTESKNQTEEQRIRIEENGNQTEEIRNQTEEIRNQTEEIRNQTEENRYQGEDRNQAKGDTDSRHILITESHPVFDLSTGQGTEGSETNSPVTLRNKRRAGNSIDSFTTTPSDLLKRRSAEIVQLRRKLEAKMKRKSLQNYCLSDDEDAGLLSRDSVDPRTLRRPLSAFGNLCRDSGNEAVISTHSSCSNSNYPSYCSTPIHRQQYRDKKPPTHAIDPKKLRYLLGDPHYSPTGHRCKCTCYNHRCKSIHCEPCSCDYRHSNQCSDHTCRSPCRNNRCSDAVTNIYSDNHCCRHTCGSYNSHSCSHSPNHRNSNLCSGQRSYNSSGHHNCADTCNNHGICKLDCHTIPYNTCDNQCISAIPLSESCNSNCGHTCHASGTCTPTPSESCNCSAVSSPCRSLTYANLQHTCRSPSPYQDADGFESQYHTPVGSPRPVKSIRPAQVTENKDGRINYYPNCDPTIWLRSCEKEILQPISGTKSGVIPTWLKGSLIRNGPGRIKVGEQQYNHVFDGSALLHRFHFHKGEITYQNKFLESRSYLRDTKAQRIVVNYFGTRAHPDPCKTILQNVASKFSFEEHFTDNAQISLYPYGDGLYALTETPFIFRVDPETLNTHEKVNLTHHIAVLTHTAHPHVDRDGTVYNIGQGVGPLGPKYHVCKFPKAKADRKGKVKSPFEQAHIVGSVNARWRLNPCYMHSFAMTPNYWVIIEQPMVVSVSKIIKVILKQDALIDALQWWEKETKIHVLRRDTGEVTTTQYITETFFFLHTINAYEDRGHIVLDIAAYKNADMLNCMFVEALKNAAYDPTYAQMFRGRPKRWVLPLNPDKDAKPGANLVTLPNTNCRGRWAKKNVVYITPELLSDIGCEVPRIYYEEYNGRPYRYFYSICSDVDHPSPGTLVKVDVVNKTHVEWSEDNVYPSEPIFVPHPEAKREDDGVVVAALLRAKGLDDQVCLLVLDATTFTELGRVEFVSSGPVPKCLHGWFVQDGTLTVHKDTNGSQDDDADSQK
ncbi:uncharacterized protein LOC125025759 [Penaeus chinensis]|uniref:uncharacterized protein LOC125025759 n=1 Tax=Penaeus chinensis TaxID=139456 RepID=UPI001FB83982|nr:uncharacterized protein LOC125025759 [Penaeus chinensis]XP_047469907.1 uncharacterized protein LOC125025759 [Penaeus chinensis]